MRCNSEVALIYLHGFKQSRSFRCLWALHEAGLEFEYIHQPIGSGITDSYREHNPQGKVPTLIDGETILTESAAILNHIGRLSGGSLIPTDTRLQAQYDEICYFVMTDLEQALWHPEKQRFGMPEELHFEKAREVAVWEFEKSQRVLHHHMRTREFAVGAGFTMADILLAHTLHWADRFGMNVDSGFLRYRDRMYQRDGAQKSYSTIQQHTQPGG